MINRFLVDKYHRKNACDMQNFDWVIKIMKHGNTDHIHSHFSTTLSSSDAEDQERPCVDIFCATYICIYMVTLMFPHLATFEHLYSYSVVYRNQVRERTLLVKKGDQSFDLLKLFWESLYDTSPSWHVVIAFTDNAAKHVSTADRNETSPYDTKIVAKESLVLTKSKGVAEQSFRGIMWDPWSMNGATLIASRKDREVVVRGEQEHLGLGE